jgi:hypothetical protein
MGVSLWHPERVYVPSTPKLDRMGRIGFAIQRHYSISDLSARLFNCSIILRNASRIAEGDYAVKLPMNKISIANAHRGDGKHFIVRADEKLTGFLELESTTDALAHVRFLE